MTTYGEVINALSKENKTLLRSKENTLKKILNAELAITFNEAYIYIYIYINVQIS